MPRRLLQIQEDMETLIREFSPEVMAIEELFFNTNVTTGIGVAQARGVILASAARLGVSIFEYTPSPNTAQSGLLPYRYPDRREVWERA